MADLFYRDMTIDGSGLDEEKRTVPVVFSTESPAQRWLGAEYLLHGPENVDLDRLRMIGAGLMNHNPDEIVGPLSEVRLSDFRGVAVLGFDDDEIGNRAMLKVKSGSLRGVSVGYRIDKPLRIFDGEEYEIRSGFVVKGPAVFGIRWTPYEISLTPIPVDIGAQVGRSLDFQRSFESSCMTLKKPERVPENDIYMKKIKLHGRFVI
jgi:phage head maturation protease